MKARMKLEKRKTCDQCEPMCINGVFCHESGCPNEAKAWVIDEWLEVYECFECGQQSFDQDIIENCCPLY